MDFVIRIWSMLDKAFDDLFIEARRDKTSVAAAAIDNKDRPVTGLCPVAEKVTSVRPDLVLYRGGTEYGAGECGKGGNAKKELVETSLHCAKVMKSMFLCASNKCDNEEDLIRNIRIVCFAQFHLHASASIMDSLNGYVCRVRTTPQYEVSNRPSMLPSRLLQILKLTLNIKRTTQATIKIVENHLMGDDVSDSDDDTEPDIKSSYEDEKKLLLPGLMQCNYKKQKRSN